MSHNLEQEGSVVKSFGLFPRPLVLCRPQKDKVRPRLELLETRALPSVTNVLVNNVAEDTSAQDTQSETSVALLPGGGVIAAFNDSEEFVGANHFTGYGVSTDGGTTFTDKGGLPTSSTGDGGDPSLAVDQVHGVTYFSTLSFTSVNRIQVFKSTDGGNTFAAPVNAFPGTPTFNQLDKDWLTVDNFAGKGQGAVYATTTSFGSTTSILFSRSFNQGKFFGPLHGHVIASGVVQGSNVVVGPDHSIYVFWLDQTSGSQIKMSKSTDFGTTFSTPTTVTTLKTTGGNGDLGLKGGFRTNTFPQAAVNPATGAIYLVVDDKGIAAGDRSDAYFTQSTDGGTTWSPLQRLNDDTTTNDQWFPAIAVTPDGSHVGVFWYDRRLDPTNNLIDRFGTIGTVSGSTVTFGANFRVTDTSFPVVIRQDPVIVSTYMGDYDQAVADNSFFYTTWGDNRLADHAHTHNPDVRLAKVPLTGPGAVPADLTHLLRSSETGGLAQTVASQSPLTRAVAVHSTPGADFDTGSGQPAAHALPLPRRAASVETVAVSLAGSPKTDLVSSSHDLPAGIRQAIQTHLIDQFWAISWGEDGSGWTW
jgi:hypothetical protein